MRAKLTIVSLAVAAGLGLSTGGWAAEQELKVRGKVAGVTLVGEALIDPASRKALVAKGEFVTILGSPTDQKNQTSNANDGTSKQRENIYVVAVTPQTAVRTSQGGEGESSQGANSAAFKKLEVGDEVEVTLKPTARGGQQGEGEGAQRTSNQSASSGSHGNNRTVAGEATSITILASGSERSAARDQRDNK